MTDHLGSTRAVIDGSGTVLETFDYYPFGLLMPQRSTGGANTLEKFTGKERDDEGGLNLDYFGARYYDPAVGRWNSVDPKADDFPAWSPYNYTFNNPINLFDPNGEDPFKFTVRSFYPGSIFGIPFTSFGDARDFSTNVGPNTTSRVSQSFVLETSDGSISNRILRSDPTHQMVFGGGGPKIFTAQEQPTGSFPAGGLNLDGSTAIETSFSGKQPIMSSLFGGLVPAIDVRTSLTAKQSDGILSISGTVSGNNFPNHELFVTDAAGNSVFLAQFTKATPGHPLINLLGSGSQLGSINVQIELNVKGIFKRAFFIDPDGNERELEIFRPE